MKMLLLEKEAEKFWEEGETSGYKTAESETSF